MRINEDVAMMLSWICEVQRVSSAVYLDPLIREAIQVRYAELYPTIRKVKALADEAAQISGHEAAGDLPQLNTLDPATGEMVTLEEMELRQEQRAADPKKKPKK